MKLLRVNRPVLLDELADAAEQLLNDNMLVAAIRTVTSIADLKVAATVLTDEVSAVKMTVKKQPKGMMCYLRGRSGHWRKNCPRQRFYNHSNEHFLNYLFFGRAECEVEGDN